MSEFHPIVPDKQLFCSRQLRSNSTFPERRLWSCLRAGRLCGLKFRRQHAIGPFIVDFYSHEHRLVVELDCASHDDSAKYDAERDRYLKFQNLRVLHITNDDVLYDLDPVLQAILLACGIDPDTGGTIVTPSP